MNGKQWFVFLGLVALGVFAYQKFLNPRCRWCGAALVALTVGQKAVCPACGASARG